jgi:molybdopterin-binding protein
VIEVRKGQTTAHVRIDIGNGTIITSSITNNAVDDLGLKVGDNAIAVIKAFGCHGGHLVISRGSMSCMSGCFPEPSVSLTGREVIISHR